MKKYLFALLSIMLFMTLALAGCGNDKNKEGNQSGGSTRDIFIYGIAADPGSNINVLTTSDRFGLMSLKAMFSPLYMYRGDDNIEYFLAESMTPSEDFLTYTAKLREDVKWHDGKPFTADDVLFTYEAIINEPASWLNSQMMFDGKPVELKKINDYEVEFVLPSVSMSAMEVLSKIFIMPKHIYEGEEDIANSPKNATPIGTGPYKFKEYKTGESLTFEKNEDYFLGEPNISTIVYRVLQDPSAAKLALKAGEVDALVVSDYTDIAELEKEKNLQLKSYTEDRVGYLAFNLTSSKVQDKEFRQALAYAINREDINIACYLSDEYSSVAPSFLPKAANFYTEDVNQFKFDSGKEKALLGDKKETLKLAYTGNDIPQQKQAQVIQQNLKDVGITVELVGMDGPALSQKLKTGHTEFDMYLNGYIMGIDPDLYGTLFMSGGPNNYMNYSNSKLDELFVQGRVETDLKKRQEIYEEVQEIIADDAAFIPLVENKRVVAFNSKLAGIEEAGLVPVYTFDDLSKLYYE